MEAQELLHRFALQDVGQESAERCSNIEHVDRLPNAYQVASYSGENRLSSVVTTSAPGKIIISGEHFVVYGSYAIAAAINKRIRVSVASRSDGESYVVSGLRRSSLSKKDGAFPVVKTVANSILKESGRKSRGIQVSVMSELPAGSGLGSSAAVAVASAAALLRFLDKKMDMKQIYGIALSGESEVHGNPSGIDIAASLQGGMIIFDRVSGAKLIPLERNVQLLVVYSGEARRTSKLIKRVQKRKKRFPALFEHLAQAASFLSLDVVDACKRGDLPRLGALMNLAQSSLAWIGVSSQSLDELIETIVKRDVFGAKITGAGGGGSVIALPKPGAADAVLERVSKKYPRSFLTSIPQEGLRWED